jgi:hypothetical protein
MLIVAIPKSASTSLLTTLEDLHNREGAQVFFPDNKLPQDVNVLHELHSDIRAITDKEVDLFSDPNKFYKQHIFPSERNKKKLADLDKVILLRKPGEIILSYYRSNQKYLSDGHTVMASCKNAEEWLIKSREIGLFQDLKTFYTEWKKEEDDLIIYFHDLVSEPEKVVNDIERFWDLKVTTGDFNLSKKRYSRVPDKVAYLNSIIEGIKSKILERERRSRLDKLALYSMNSLRYLLSPEIWDKRQKLTPNFGKLPGLMKGVLSHKINEK